MTSILPGRKASIIDRTRTDEEDETMLVAYRNLQAPGDPSPWFGDDDGPFVWPQGMVSVDGTTGITPQTVPGGPQKIGVDPWGRLWITSADELPNSYLATSVGTGETSSSIAVGGHRLVEVAVFNPSGGTLFLQVFDLVGVPADGTVPAITAIPVPANTTVAVEIDDGILFGNGITVVLSTTALVLTASGVSASFTIVYR